MTSLAKEVRVEYSLWDTSVQIISFGGVAGIAIYGIARLIDWFSKLPENRSEDDQF